MFVLTNNEEKNAAEVLHLQLSQLVELLYLAMILLTPVEQFFLHFHPAPRYNVKTVTNDHITQLNPTLIGFTSTLSGGFGLTSVWILWIETPRSCATYGSTNMFNMCNIWILCFEMPRCCATLLGLVLRWRCNREWASWSKWDPRWWF